MKKFSKSLAVVMALALTVSSVSPATADAVSKKPAWKKSTTKVAVGKKYTFIVKNLPSKGKVTFKSNKSSVLKITKKTKTTATVKGIKAGKAVLKAIVKDKKGKTVKVLSKKVTVAKKNNTAKPTTTPGVIVDSIKVESINQINNTSFTVSVSATKNGKKLSEMLKSEVEKELAGSSLNFICQENGLTLKAQYESYSADNDLIIYKMDAESIKKLQPAKNNGKVGSADGTYIVSGEKIYVGEGIKTAYNESLIGNSVSGYIYDEVLDTPISNAKVTAFTSDDQMSDTTDENGYYYIPLSAGKYNIKAEGVDAAKNSYFATTDSIEVSANNKTACNMQMDTYNREEFFINGSIRNADTSKAFSDAIVSLYEVKEDGTEVKLAEITTDNTGEFVFRNSQSEESVAYQAIVNKYQIKEKDSRVKTFSYNNGLDRNKNYKVVISKELSTKNIADVYETKVLSDIKMTDSQQYNLGDIKITPVKEVKNMVLKGNWENADNIPDREKKQTKLHVSFCYEKNAGVWKELISDDITVDIDLNQKSFSYDLAAKNFFGKEYPTLPNGKYYVVVQDNNENNAIVTQGIEVTAGEITSNPGFVIPVGKSTGVTIDCTVNSKKAVANIEKDGIIKVVKDEEGIVLTPEENVSLKCAFYQKVGDDKIYINTFNKELKKEINDKIFSASAKTGISRTVAGAQYVVEPVQSYISADNKEFTQAAEDSDSIQLKCKGAANIEYIKVDKKELFRLEKGKTLPEQLGVDNIKLLAEDGTVKGEYIYRSNTEVNTADLLSKGVKVPTDAVAFKGVLPGKYKIQLDLVDFEPVTSEAFDVIDFQQVTVNVTNNIEFTQKIAISGAVTAGDGDIQDKDVNTIDALILLYDKNGIIVGATTYGNKKDANGELSKDYAFVNGENAYLEAGATYTLVIRSSHNDGQTAFETQEVAVTTEDKKNTKQNLEVVKGNDAGITISAKDENNNNLENPVVALVDSQWSKYHEFKSISYKKNISGKDWWSTFAKIYSSGYGIKEVLEASIGQDPNLVGIYPLERQKAENEWKIEKALPGNTYTAYVAADKVETLELKDIVIKNSQHVTKTDDNNAPYKLKLIDGENTVLVELNYEHRRPLYLSVPFDMIEIINANDEVIKRKYLSQEETKNNVKENAYAINKVDLYVPNVSDKYTIKIYSNGSFIKEESVVLQGTSNVVNSALSKSSTN